MRKRINTKLERKKIKSKEKNKIENSKANIPSKKMSYSYRINLQERVDLLKVKE